MVEEKAHAKVGGESSRGFTILEMLFAMAILGVCLGIAIPNIKALSDPLDNGAALLVSHIKQVRSVAVSTTSAYRLAAVSSTRVEARFSNRCTDAQAASDPKLTFVLPKGATLASTSWNVCFSSRGLADSNPEIVIRDASGDEKKVKVYIGGGVRVL